jgi:Protein of unknown function (DUF3352)
MRRQPVLAVLTAAIAVVAVVVAVTRGSGAQPPATGAARVVPADVLAYLHVSTDPKRSAVRDALALGPRLPTYPLAAAQVISRLTALIGGGAKVNFTHDIRPWLGGEVALALLNSAGSSAGSELVLDVARPARARAFIALAGAVPAGSYRGAKLYRYRSGARLAFVSHYLILGQGSSVRAGLDAARGVARSLAASGDYRSAAAGEPADRVIDAYVSTDGVRRLLIPQGGLFAGLGGLLEQPALTGATVSLSASGTTARLRVHSAFARAGTGRSFGPSLGQLLPAGTVFELDLSDIARAGPHVLGAIASVGIAGQVGPLLGRLGAALRAEGVNLSRVESLFAGETSVAVDGGGALIVLTRVKDEQAARTELANLEIPLSALFPAPSTGSGQVPQFSDRQVDGITAHQLSLGTGLRLNYAVFHGLLVISTSLAGIGAVAHHSGALTGEPGYRAALGDTPSRVTSLVFLDFSQLLDLAGRTGLLRGARFQALAPDFERIRAVGLDSTRGEVDSTAELTLQIK